ncbi:MAG TPA: 16S rRNA (cytosine(1402)-N(4))-methyltransferase RsmH, partial [Polyangiaceae bacterium LLY-WYZ-15_(1-7)]|nr:16S rRNA (cytosine(1402)-N(4))-methyltransferase RsmH [Polyangiaceae bacterium LLY-WYZ-15_(1-7)]
MTGFHHVSVLLEETVDALAPRAGGVYVDATLGGGGHAEAILERSAPDGRLVGLDRDPAALAAAGERLARFGERVTLVKSPFGRLAAALADVGLARVDGVVADVGVSSPQLDDPARGFSFRESGPLDMRMDPTSGETAKELIARLDSTELADLIYALGEERRSRPIARAIKEAEAAGELETTDDLRRAVHRVMKRRGKIDTATRTFQALRIAVNEELDQLGALLAQLPDVVEDGGVAAVISFHSLEDRKVKRAFKGDRRWKPQTKKP